MSTPRPANARSRFQADPADLFPAEAANWVCWCPNHPNRECAFNQQRQCAYCAKCGMWFSAKGVFVEREPLERLPSPTPCSALGNISHLTPDIAGTSKLIHEKVGGEARQALFFGAARAKKT